jgi:DNA topoisomerase-1
MNKKVTKNTSINIVVIVESPAKCNKIEGYLGPGYKVFASFGHLRTLDGLKSIDIENKFKPNYTLIQEPIKLKQIEKLRSEIAKADEVIIATDSDREGEAIAWHICDLFSLSIKTTKRIIFNEVTEQALQTAIRHPKLINMDLVLAQQSRQILDLLVGYTITPFLWQCVSKTSKNSLSAGRCQTPALRLIYDNYLEIQKSSGSLIYNTGGYFTNMNLLFELNKQFVTKDEALDFLEHCKSAKYLCTTSTPKKSIRKAPEPLTTSTLQQMASNELHISPKETMKYAQQLYEAGYITYMRTDSKKYSNTFVSSVKSYIENIYGQTYVSQNIDALISDLKKEETKEEKYKKTADLIQEAHEAIRPVSISVKSVIEINKESNTEIVLKAQKLYALIWAKTLESCMASAQYNVLTAKIQLDPPHETKSEFSYKTEQVTFEGWQIVEGVTTSTLVKEYQYFLAFKADLLVIPKKIESKYNLINLKSHYTEARLVQLLEEKGIGRPSTFASLIDKIQEREYVKRQNIEGRKIEGEDFLLINGQVTETIVKREFGNESNKLVIQPIGIIVIEFLLKHFDSFFNYDYTRDMENELDLIATNKRIWTTLCENCFQTLISITKDLKEEPKFSLKIDDFHTLIIGKFGPVVRQRTNDTFKKDSFIPVRKDLDISKAHLLKLEDIIELTQVKGNGAIGKYKGEDLFVKKGKYGVYAQWSKDGKPETKTLKELDGKPLEQIEYIEVLRILEKDTTLDSERPIGFVRELSPTLSIRTGQFGDYIFYKKPRIKTPQFFKLKGFTSGTGSDARKCDKEVLLNWIKLTYNVE